MGNYLNPDNINFQKIIGSSIYVDKTGLIELTNERLFSWNDSYVCVSRPRRFGKSIAAETLVAYYSKGCDSKELFDGLEISKCADFEEHLNRYNVIHLVMTDFLNSDKSMKDIVNDVTGRLIREIRREYSNIEFMESDLESIMEQTFKESGMPFIFIVDEWDCVFRERRNDMDGQNDYLKFLRGLFKDKKYVALCYMTGILPIRKAGDQSTMNMFKEISMTRPGKFAKYTGFTEDEVKALCERYGRSYEDIENYYKGYNVKGLAIYNPVDINKCMCFKEIDAYWAKTEDYTLLTQYFDIDGVKEAVEKMLAGEKVKVETGRFDNSMTKLRDCDDVLALLVHLGYLTYEYVDYREWVWIPNEEIRKQFETNLNLKLIK